MGDYFLEYLNSKNVQHEYYCRYLYSVSGNVKRIKLATNRKTIKIQQGRLYIQKHEQFDTPVYHGYTEASG